MLSLRIPRSVLLRLPRATANPIITLALMPAATELPEVTPAPPFTLLPACSLPEGADRNEVFLSPLSVGVQPKPEDFGLALFQCTIL